MTAASANSWTSQICSKTTDFVEISCLFCHCPLDIGLLDCLIVTTTAFTSWLVTMLQQWNDLCVPVLCVVWLLRGMCKYVIKSIYTVHLQSAASCHTTLT